MADASRDGNFVPTLLGVSNVDGTTPVKIYADPVTHRLLVSLSGTGSGDVVGPASATDNAIARFDGVTGKLIQNSNVTISDTGAITIASTITLPIVDGTNGQVLQTNGAGVVSWGTVSGAGGITRSINVVSTPTNAGSTASTDYVYLVSGTTTVTLPTAVGNTNRYTIKRVGVNTVTIATTSAQTIDGSASATLNVQYESLDLVSDNANWNII